MAIMKKLRYDYEFENVLENFLILFNDIMSQKCKSRIHFTISCNNDDRGAFHFEIAYYSISGNYASITRFSKTRNSYRQFQLEVCRRIIHPAIYDYSKPKIIYII